MKPATPDATTLKKAQWHEYPCPHFLEAIEQDQEMLYNPVTGQLTHASRVN
jgi:hypothetical protein